MQSSSSDLSSYNSSEHSFGESAGSSGLLHPTRESSITSDEGAQSHKESSSIATSLEPPRGSLPTDQASSKKAKKHRSVRSLTREYENQTSTGETSSSLLSPSSSSSSTTAFPLSTSPPTSSTSLSPTDRPRRSSGSSGGGVSSHGRRASVLLASPSYPSTLAVNEPGNHYERQRTISGGSISSQELGRSPSVRLASPNYPSTYHTSPSLQPSSLPTPNSRPEPVVMTTGSSAGGSGRNTPMMHRRKGSSKDLTLSTIGSNGMGSLPTLSVSFDDQADEGGDFDHDDKKASAAGESELGEEEDNEELMDSLGELGFGGSTANDAGSAKALSQMTPAEKREHSRRHSRVHSRNLSVFFPRPGSEAEKEADEIRAGETFGSAQNQKHPSIAAIQTQGLSGPDAQRTDSDMINGSTISSSSGSGLSPARDVLAPPASPSKSRKGHHRKHSVNHAMFDGTRLQVDPNTPLQDFSTPPSAASNTLWSAASSTFQEESHSATQPHLHHHYSDHAHDYATPTKESTLDATLSKPFWHHVAMSSLPPSHRPLLLFGLFHFALGAALWVSGQSGDSLSMSGLGYLVVFDALGVISGCGAEWVGEAWKRQRDARISVASKGQSAFVKSTEELRRPYGAQRVETLLHFVQSIYLVFASVYVCKESIEHALLEGSDEHHAEDSMGLILPTTMLLLATGACIFSNIFLHNHAKLVAACGISTAASDAASSGGSSRPRRRGHGRAGSVLVDPKAFAGPFLHLVSNPFSLTVLFFSTVLALASIFMPPFQVAALDKVLAGMESAAMIYVAWPASKALGKVLLQTAPNEWSPQSVQLMRTLKTIEGHKLVTFVAPPHLWQLTPPTSALAAGAATAAAAANASGSVHSSSLFGSLLPGGSVIIGSASRSAKHAALIATLKIFLKEEASDDDVLQVTKWAWQLAAPSVGAGAGLRPGETLRGSTRAGELIVEVQREGARDRYLVSARNKYGAPADHLHHHDHDHDHDHDHQHHHHNHDHQHHHHDHLHHSHHYHSHNGAEQRDHSQGHDHAHHSPHLSSQALQFQPSPQQTHHDHHHH